MSDDPWRWGDHLAVDWGEGFPGTEWMGQGEARTFTDAGQRLPLPPAGPMLFRHRPGAGSTSILTPPFLPPFLLPPLPAFISLSSLVYLKPGTKPGIQYITDCITRSILVFLLDCEHFLTDG